MNVLLQPCYFAPIAQYAKIFKAKSISFEVCDHYQKQTYRNRCHIATAQGRHALYIPIKHNRNRQRSLTKDVQIDYKSSHWQKRHLHSLQTAYRSSPFFEFFEPDILDIFSKKHKYLLDLNLATHDFIMEALQESRPTFQTKTYQITTDIKDCRNLANAKKDIIFDKTYTQIFDDKHPFLSNLSILDLLFMQGTSAAIYLGSTAFLKI